MANKYNTIIFDLDGTLLDTASDLQNAMNLTMNHYGFPTHSRENIISFINDGARMLVTRALPESEREEKRVSEILKTYLEMYDKYPNEKTTAYEGVVDLVKQLKIQGYKLAVVSNKPDRHTKLLAKFYFGEDTFDYVSGSGDDLPIKPDRLCIDLALEKMGCCDTEKVLFVGDSHVDVTTAKNAQVDCVGVTWGFHGKNGFRDTVPNFYADNAKKLYDIIAGRV